MISGAETSSRLVPQTRAVDTPRRRRGILHTTVTKHMTALDALLQNPAARTLDLNTHLNIILDKQLALHKLDNQIQASLTDDEFDAVVLAAIDYNERMCALSVCVYSMTSPASSASAIAIEFAEPSGSAVSQRRPAVPQATQGTRFNAFPKLQIPTFSGDRCHWQGFPDQYDMSIHSRPAFPCIEKFI